MIHLKHVLGLIVAFSIGFSDSSEWNNNQKIRKRLLEHYDKRALPQQFHNGTTTVYMYLLPRSINIDDASETMITHSWLAMVWVDPRLKWDPKDFGNLNSVHFGDDELWKPDITVYNNADISEVDHYGNVHFLVFETGVVYWVPPTSTTTHCIVDLKLWPFDQHECNITFTSWTTSGWQINLDFFNNATEITMRRYTNTSSQWQVMSHTQRRLVVYYGSYPEPYFEMEFSFVLKRNAPSFSTVVIVPAVVIPLMLLVQFIVPVDQKQRMALGYICAILVVIELLFMKLAIPKVGSRAPLIVSYYGLAFVLVCVTIMVNAILGRLCHKQNPLLDFPPPAMLKQILTGVVANILCIRENASQVGLSGKMSEDGEVLESGLKSPSYHHEWLLIAKAADRIWLVIFMVISFISMISFLSQLK